MKSTQELYLFFLELFGIVAFIIVSVVSIYFYLKDSMQMEINSGRIWKRDIEND